MADAADFTLRASAAASSSASGSGIDIGELREAAAIQLDVTALVGSLVVKIESAPAEAGPWRLVEDRIVYETGTTKFWVGDLDRWLRASHEIEAGDSSTFSVESEAHVVYANLRHLEQFSAPTRAWQDTTPSQRVAACHAATSVADGYLGKVHEMPLLAWSTALTLYVSWYAAWIALTTRGVDLSGADMIFQNNMQEALNWFEAYGKGDMEDPGIIDQTIDVDEGAYAEVYSEPLRGI